MGINIVVQLVYTPLMLRLLGQSEYGLYTLVASIVSYLSLFSLSFTASYTRFYTKYKEKKDREGEERLNGMFLTIFLVMAVLALVCGMVLAQFPKQVFGSRLTINELDRAQVLMRILVVNIALTFLTGLLESIITAHECFVFQRIVVLVSAMMNPFICLPFLLMGHTSITIVVVTTIISVAKLVVDAGYCLRRLHIRFRFDGFDVSLLKEIANFNFFILLSLLVDQVNWSVDKFILGHVSGTKAVAVYGVGAQINALFQLFATAISSVFVPRVNQIAAQNRADTNVRLTTLLTKVGRMQCLVLFLFSSGLVFAVNQEKYDGSYILTSLKFARQLFQYTTEVSAINLKMKEGTDIDAFKRKLEKHLGERFRVFDRYEQQADTFRIGNIGDVHPADFKRLIEAIREISL
jgi:O-antigen/teichoic acid export membrane protein